MNMKSQTALTYTLLISVVIIWALAWPTSKIALVDIPPIWFTTIRLWIGFVTVLILLLIQKKIKLPTLKDGPLILSIGLLQMACFLIFLNGGLLFVDAGRSAILVYSTPFLVTPIVIIFFGEKFTKLKFLGLVLGLLGLLLLFMPWSFDWSNKNVIIGNGLLLLSTTCWAIAMIHTRYGTWHSPSIQLALWQLLIASIFVTIVCFILNPHPKINWTHSMIASALYNGILATGFAYTIITFITQRLPVIKISLLLLAVPVLGVLCSAIWLHEKLTTEIILALLLIVGGLVAISLEKN